MHPAASRAVPARRAAGEGATLPSVVRELCESHDGLARSGPSVRHPALPSREALAAVVDGIRAVFFPGYVGTTSEFDRDSLPFYVGATLDEAMQTLTEQVRRALCFTCNDPNPPKCPDCERRADDVAAEFLARLPAVRRLLATDVQAAYDGDPAATSPAETILCYPGILAITCQRIAHELYALGVPLLPRIITEHAHGMTGIDIHPGARIGERFFIDHGTGVVIGETSEIGNRVRLYQGVTLGAKSFPLDEHGRPVKGVPRHPIVEDDVIVYSGATVLGRITIGAGSIIGGNVWLTHSVPAGSRISQQTEARHAKYTGGAGI